MEIKVSIDNYEIASSGVVSFFLNQKIKFKIQNLTFILDFKEDKQNITSRTETKIEKDTTMFITFINSNNTLGTYNTKPISIGTIGDKSLFFNFRIFGSNDKSGALTLQYTWLLGDKSCNE